MVSGHPWDRSSASGSHLGSLNIHMEEQGARRRLFSVSSMQGDAWHYGSVAVQADGEWKVRQGAKGSSVLQLWAQGH